MSDKNSPPNVQMLAFEAGHVSGHTLCFQVVAVVPWFLGTNKVNDFHALSESEYKHKKNYHSIILVLFLFVNEFLFLDTFLTQIFSIKKRIIF